MTLKLDNKPRFKNLKKVFFSYYRFSITDFFSRFTSLLKYKNKSWQQIKSWSFFLNTKSNNFLFKTKKPRFNYIMQNRSCLIYTKVAGHRKKRYLTDVYNAKFNMKLFGLYNQAHVHKAFGSILKKSKGNRNFIFKNLILTLDNQFHLFLFRHYFVNTISHGTALTKQHQIFMNDQKIVQRNSFLNKGSIFKLNINTISQLDLLKDILLKKVNNSDIL